MACTRNRAPRPPPAQLTGPALPCRYCDVTAPENVEPVKEAGFKNFPQVAPPAYLQEPCVDAGLARAC
jgi:hypothetical protein